MELGILISKTHRFPHLPGQNITCQNFMLVISSVTFKMQLESFANTPQKLNFHVSGRNYIGLSIQIYISGLVQDWGWVGL